MDSIGYRYLWLPTCMAAASLRRDEPRAAIVELLLPFTLV